MDEIKKIEDTMAEWLAHPMEFGVAPKFVRYLRTYKLTLIGDGDVDIHLVEYEVADHPKSRGFVNSPLTWSFLGDISKFSDDELLVAYCGWAWIFPRIQAGTVLTNFASNGEEARYIAQKKAQGFTDIRVFHAIRLARARFTRPREFWPLSERKAQAAQRLTQFFLPIRPNSIFRPYIHFLALKLSRR
ncbi:MAG TPA: hypothetical protein VH280_13660 [Verrucomicrobiae bacterium]|jgi:hypothetical protein|nr:hypothetical protein [Verrucomicrobiae bacterium]